MDALGSASRGPPVPPNRLGLIAALEAVRRRAAHAAAAAVDGTPCAHNNHVDRLSSSASLEAALEATDVSDNDLRELASALAMEAATSFLCLQATSQEKRCRLAWAAVALSLTRPQWPPQASSLTAIRASDSEKLTSLDAIGRLRRWGGLRLAVPCKHILSGGEDDDDNRAQVTCLTYLPLAMLLASGYSNGRVRLWDPCARRHKIAPPPPPDEIGRGSGKSRCETAGIRGEGSSGRHLRIWPGIYVKAAEEWTEEGVTFGCIASFGAVAKAPRRGENGGDGKTFVKVNSGDGGGGFVKASGGDGDGFVKVKALHSIVLPGGGTASLIVCDSECVQRSRRMDEEKPWDPTSAGECFPTVKTVDNRKMTPPPRLLEEAQWHPAQDRIYHHQQHTGSRLRMKKCEPYRHACRGRGIPQT